MKKYLNQVDIYREAIPLALLERKIGTNRKQFKEMKQEVPCFKCIVLAACKGKSNIECELLLKYLQLCVGYGANTLVAHKELVKLFPNTTSFNGTVIL